MKTRLTLILILTVSFNGFSQTKGQTIRIINQLLAKAVGKTDTIITGDKRNQFTLTANSFFVDEAKNTGNFKTVQTFKNPDKKESIITSIISDWKGFKVSSSQKNATINSIYPLFQKRNGEADNAKNGVKHYCLAGDENQLISALMHLKTLYARN